MRVDNAVAQQTLYDIFMSQGRLIIAGKDVDFKSFKFSCKCQELDIVNFNYLLSSMCHHRPDHKCFRAGRSFLGNSGSSKLSLVYQATV